MFFFVLDSYLKYSSDKSATISHMGLPPSISNNASHLAAAQVRNTLSLTMHTKLR